MPDVLSLAQARRVALAAQGFGRAAPSDPGLRQVDAVVQRMGLLQVDSVNVFERSHYLPVLARLGPYDRALLDRLTFGARPRYVETWAHVASLVPVETWPLWRWRMDATRDHDLAVDGWPANNRAMLDWLRSELETNGPMAASDIDHEANVSRGPWWGWSDVKLGLEYLFRWGEVVPAGRRRFERVYGLAHQVLPAELLDARVSRADAHRELLRTAARAHGIGTLSDLADYHRLAIRDATPAIADLVDAGELVPVTVAGWSKPAYLHRDARLPRRIDTVALLSPFDPVVWERDRTLRLFDFFYRIEIYTPAAKRQYGYYTLPLLLDDRLVGRVDLKSDRQERVLRVQSAWREDASPATAGEIAERLVPLLQGIRSWQALESITVADRGTLAPELRAALARG